LEKKEILGDCDLISIAGGVKTINSPKNISDVGYILNQIDLAYIKHGVREIIFCNHTDCGAYKEFVSFSSPEEERTFHINEMKKASQLILSKYSDVKIKTVLGIILPDGKVEMREVQ
jgi:carbonic anhydrase